MCCAEARLAYAYVAVPALNNDNNSIDAASAFDAERRCPN